MNVKLGIILQFVLRATLYLLGQLLLTFPLFEFVKYLSAVLTLPEILSFWKSKQIPGYLIPFAFILGFSIFYGIITLLFLLEFLLIFQTNVSYFACYSLQAFLTNIQLNSCLYTEKLYWFFIFTLLSKLIYKIQILQLKCFAWHWYKLIVCVGSVFSLKPNVFLIF